MKSVVRVHLEWAVVLTFAGLFALVVAVPPGEVERRAIGAIGALLLAGSLYVLFGEREWSSDVPPRRHATFLLVHAGLAFAGTVLLRSVANTSSSVGRTLLALVLLGAVGTAAWLAYDGGAARLGEALGR